jgi:hypothetical protein
MSEEKNEKRCSGCKTPKSLDSFYKNKLVLDGHSNYCIDCTRENSKKYFQRKKLKISKIENDTLLKMAFLNIHSINCFCMLPYALCVLERISLSPSISCLYLSYWIILSANRMAFP